MSNWADELIGDPAMYAHWVDFIRANVNRVEPEYRNALDFVWWGNAQIVGRKVEWKKR